MREFDLMAGVGFMAELVIEVHHRTEQALERAARLVEREAKAELGAYQGAAPPFAPWAPLADSTKADRVREGYPADEPGLRSGEMRDSIGHRVDASAGHGEATVGSDDDNLVWFELGTSKQPPRSVLGGALVRKSGRVAEILGEGVVKALVGGGTRLQIK